MDTFRRRLKRMDAQQCFDFSQCPEGAISLRTPNGFKRTSRDPNRGLYPRTNNKSKHVSKLGRLSHDKKSAICDMDLSKKQLDTTTPPLLNKCCSIVENASKNNSQPIDLSLSGKSNVDGVRKNLFPVKTSTKSNNIQRQTASYSHAAMKNDIAAIVEKPSVNFTNFNSDRPIGSLSSPNQNFEIPPWRRTPEKRRYPSSHTEIDSELNDLFDSPSKRQQTSPSSQDRKSKKAQTPQKNTLLNYFSSPSKNVDKEAISPSAPNKIPPLQARKSDQSKTVRVKLEYESPKVNPSTVEQNKQTLTSPISMNVCDNKKEKNGEMSTYVFNDSNDEKKIEEKAKKEFEDIYGLIGSELSWTWDENDQMIDSLQSSQSSQDDRPSPFLLLPAEIIENIFCHLPLQELCLNLTRVSKQWNNIISNEQFIPWKKKYYQLKYQVPLVHQSITVLCKTNKIDTVATCLQGLLRYVIHFKPYKQVMWEKMLLCLQSHPKYEWAKAMLLERFPECFVNQNPSPWCIIASLCILSHSVKDISIIIRNLSHPLSGCLLIDVIDFFYCLATFFFYFITMHKINSGYHYRIYYALYLFENSGVVTVGDIKAFTCRSTGQQTIRRYENNEAVIRLTHEQKRIVNHQLSPNDTVKIIAFAGTGKTTTLVEFTKMWPSKKFLNVVFNKSVCDYAKKIFPSNVTCLTAHSLAYRTVGVWFKSKLKFQIKPLDYMQLLNGDKQMLRAGIVAKTIANFVSSADDFITIAHVPTIASKLMENGTQKVFTSEEKLGFCEDATYVWRRMSDCKDFQAKISHDDYLKLYQLEKIPIKNFDCILLDEAQDYSAAMLSIFLRQNCPKIIVGDPHQQIYSFRGAVNALDNITATHTYYLTQSFRFGPEIGYAANCALEVMKRERRKTLIGSERPGGINEKRVGQVAIIARTNFTLFSEAVRICCTEDKQVHAAFLGGIRNYSLDQVLDIYKLMQISNGQGTKESVGIKSKFIGRFKSFQTLLDYAIKTDDVELQGKIRIVQKYNIHLPQYIEKIKQKCRYSLELAEIVFTTAHKAKGQEFDTVQLTDDYIREAFKYNRPQLYMADNQTPDEANILYVAMTRAKYQLFVSPQVMNMFLVAGERFEYPVALSNFHDEPWFGTEKYVCVSCRENRPFQKNRALVLQRKEIILSTRERIKGGLLCHVCANSQFFQLSEFIPSPLIGPPCKDSNHESLSPLLGCLGEKELEEVKRNELNQENVDINPEWFGIYQNQGLILENMFH